MLRFESTGQATEHGYCQYREVVEISPDRGEQYLLSLCAINSQVYNAGCASQATADLWSEHPFFAAPWHGLTDPAENEPFQVLAA